MDSPLKVAAKCVNTGDFAINVQKKNYECHLIRFERRFHCYLLTPSNLLIFFAVFRNTLRTNTNTIPKRNTGIRKYGLTVPATMMVPTMLRITLISRIKHIPFEIKSRKLIKINLHL